LSGRRSVRREITAELGGFGGFAGLCDCVVEEASDCSGRMGADEAGDGLAVAEDGDGGDALDAVLGGERQLGVDVTSTPAEEREQPPQVVPTLGAAPPPRRRSLRSLPARRLRRRGRECS